MKFWVSLAKSLFVVALVAAGFASCGLGDNSGSQLSLFLTDKPTHEFDAVCVTIGDIAVHKDDDPEGYWNTILHVDETFNLLDLGGGVRKQLGIVDLEPGHYTQMRLMIGDTPSDGHEFANYVTVKGTNYPMKIPSGFQTGIKLVQGFDINENSTTELIFDFDASRSVVIAGNSGKYLLKPTIHMIDDSQVRMTIKGNVVTTGDSGDVGLEGANVSLQIYNPPVEDQDLKDQVEVFTSTVTDETGAYMFFFLNVPEPVTYNVVATKWVDEAPYYAPGWDQIPKAVNGNVYPVDFNLPVPAEVGTLGLKAIIPDGDAEKNLDPETIVTISIRQITELDGAPVVEVKSIDIVGYDDEYLFTDITAVDITLPVGDYTVVASSAGWVSVAQDITITAAGPNPIEFTFTTPDTI